MAFATEQHKTLYPVHISLFSANAVMLQPDLIPYLIKQLGRLGGRCIWRSIWGVHKKAIARLSRVMLWSNWIIHLEGAKLCAFWGVYFTLCLKVCGNSCRL